MRLCPHKIMVGEELGVGHESGFRPSGHIVTAHMTSCHKEQERDVGTESLIPSVDVRGWLRSPEENLI